MKNRQTIISSLIVAMALGTAWAVRGKFGHEQAAAWAEASGGLAIILVAKRSDWNNKVFKVALREPSEMAVDLCSDGGDHCTSGFNCC